MECGSGFQELASRNPFVRDLEEQGYLLDFVNGYFIVYGIPYLDANGALQHGDWASPVNRDAEGVVGTPGEGEHQAWFRGSRPHDGHGRPLKLGGGDAQVTISDDFVTDHSFSLKLQDAGQNRLYRSFEEKLHTYIDMITGPAMAAFEDATPLRAIEKRASAQDSPLRIPDDLWRGTISMTSRSCFAAKRSRSSGSAGPAPTSSISSHEPISRRSASMMTTRSISTPSSASRASSAGQSAGRRSRLSPGNMGTGIAESSSSRSVLPPTISRAFEASTSPSSPSTMDPQGFSSPTG